MSTEWIRYNIKKCVDAVKMAHVHVNNDMTYSTWQLLN